ncbi:MAG TPA: S49 family peptidase, partial [Thermoguttaceae bacterium]|nr:S49 family peptidase [Thermoguttaceae bacterium]
MQRMTFSVWIVLALCLPLCVATSATAKDKKNKKETVETETTEQKTPAKKVDVVQIRLRGGYPEGPTSMDLFGEMQASLAATIQKIDQAAEDDEVAALWLDIEGVSTGRGKIHELRSAIARFRKTGKPAYAQLTSAETGSYLLAAACDEIVMPPSGMLIVPGVRAEVTFYKGLFDKLGVEFDMLQMGQYKGAAEPYTRTEMSPAMRESLEGVLDDTYENMATTIAADRKLDVDKVKELLDQGLFTAEAAQQAGLVDQVAYADALQKSMAKKLQADEVNLVTDYRKKKVDTDFSGMSGMFKFMELMMGGSPTKSSDTKTKIAVVYAVGPIMLGSSSTDMLGSSSLGSTTLIAALRKAADDPKVAAIVLRIDSPGGSAVASDLIWRETVRIEKPIIASMGDVAGSGGYYIAM